MSCSCSGGPGGGIVPLRMPNPILTFLVDDLSAVFSERPSAVSPWFYDYFEELTSDSGRSRYARALQADLNLARVSPEGKIVMDAGSGFGVTLLCLASLNPRMALGLEVFRTMSSSSEVLRSRYAEALPAAILRGSVHDAPLRDESIDFIYCNEAYSHFRYPAEFLREAGRLLKPGGTLMICDGNNGLNPRTVRRVLEIWKRFEEGPPGDDIHGHRVEVPYRDRRRALIAEEITGLSDDTLDRLAWGTFRLHGSQIMTEARRLLASGALPEAPPRVDVSPVDPVKGDFIENLLYPEEIARSLREQGFSVKVYAHFAGARSPLLAAVNSVLRSMTPWTIRLARSVKIVATRPVK